jgi:hypothetical protein
MISDRDLTGTLSLSWSYNRNDLRGSVVGGWCSRLGWLIEALLAVPFAGRNLLDTDTDADWVVRDVASIADDHNILSIFIFANRALVFFDFFNFGLFRVFFEPSSSVEIGDLLLIGNFICGCEDVYG